MSAWLASRTGASENLRADVPVGVHVAVGAVAWFIVNGFLVDRLGELRWHGPADVARAAALTTTAAAGLVIGQRRVRRSDRSIEEEK